LGDSCGCFVIQITIKFERIICLSINLRLLEKTSVRETCEHTV
jgi:hypothetical protein